MVSVFRGETFLLKMADENKVAIPDPKIEALFRVGAHFAYSKSRRHPSSSQYIFGSKARVEIFDLEKTNKALEEAKAYVSELGKLGKQILFVSGKSEAKEAVEKGANAISQPYVAGRFIGGTLTNFPQIRKRVERFEDLSSKRDSGELLKFTKKERLLIGREIETLERNFGGIVSMKSLPAAVFVIDPKREHIAIEEANKIGISVIALSNSDCNISNISYPIPGNDSSRASVEYFVHEIVTAYKGGKIVSA